MLKIETKIEPRQNEKRNGEKMKKQMKKQTKKQMKKQEKQTMKLAGALAITVLMTMSLIGTALAKYITETTLTDTARVAYWGIGEESSVNLFAKAYIDEAVEEDDAQRNVLSLSDDNVVAPGTTGYASIELTAGEDTLPEVAFTLLAEVEVDFDGWEEEDCPLIFTVNGNEVESANGALAAAIKEAIGEHEKYIPEKGGTLTLPKLEISWEWPFESTEDADVVDEKDTAFGNLGTDKIAVSAMITAVQVD